MKKHLSLVILLAIVLIGAVGYFILKESPASFSSNDIANWKTYRSDQYGFEFKYPNDWSIEVYQTSPFAVMVFPKGFEKDKRDMAFTIDPINVGRESEFDAGANLNIQDAKVGGKKAKIYSCPEQNQCPTQLSYRKSVKVTELPKNWTKDNEIGYSIRNGYGSLRDIFELVLNSIKF